MNAQMVVLSVTILTNTIALILLEAITARVTTALI